jgi:hypothetical protein
LPDRLSKNDGKDFCAEVGGVSLTHLAGQVVCRMPMPTRPCTGQIFVDGTDFWRGWVGLGLASALEAGLILQKAAMRLAGLLEIIKLAKPGNELRFCLYDSRSMRDNYHMKIRRIYGEKYTWNEKYM